MTSPGPFHRQELIPHSHDAAIITSAPLIALLAYVTGNVEESLHLSRDLGSFMKMVHAFCRGPSNSVSIPESSGNT